MSTRITSTQPTSRARLRFCSDISMKVAGRKIVGSTATPAERGLHLFERLFDAAGDRQRVGPELLLDDQHQARTAVDHGVANRRGEALDDRGHVADPQHGTVARRDDDRFEVAHRRHRGPVGDGEPLIRRVQEAARPAARRRRRRPGRPGPPSGWCAEDGRDRRAPAADGRAVPRSPRWPPRESPSAADGSSISRACSARPGSACPR